MPPRSPYALRAIVALLTPIVLAPLLQSACRHAAEEVPVVALATSPEAEARFSRLRSQWAVASPAQRAEMRKDLDDLHTWLEQHGDGLEPSARAYLAVAWIDADVPAAAEAIARPLYEGAPGVSHDLGTLVRGVAARRQGRSKEAIEILQPIVGKLIDPFARPMLDEEMTQALIDSGRYDEAIVFAQAWLGDEAGDDRKSLHAAVAKVLERIPIEAARRAIDAERATKGAAGYSPEMILILSARANETPPDVASDGDADVSDDDASSDAAWLASLDGATVTVPLPIRFDPRGVALLLPASAPGQASIAGAVVRGASAVITPPPSSIPIAKASTSKDAGRDAADALELEPPSPASHHLAVFDTTGTARGVSQALDAAERDGAAIVIGGATDVEANQLAALAQSRKIAAVLLRAPTSPPSVAASDRTYFTVIGPSSRDEAKATFDAAASVATAGATAVVDPYPDANALSSAPSADPLHARCDAAQGSATATAFPIDAWRAGKVARIVVLGDARCAERVAEEVASVSGAAYRPELFLAPSCLELVHRALPLARSALTSGVLPADDDAPEALQRLWHDQKAPVGWWAALGRDAATLALAATPGDLLPTIDPLEIGKARITTLKRLLDAKVELWTTTAAGFDSAGALPRAMMVRSVAAGGAWRPAWLAGP